jgi:hypothetical protein
MGVAKLYYRRSIVALDSDTKEFLLHLYDKLWENMGAKEERLWKYLAVYGAAIALALGVGQYAGIALYGTMIGIALTVWALLIAINANWWYHRNRLMVTQIEKKFSIGGALDGVIPRSYRDAKFEFDRLYRGSILILSAIAALLYLKIMWQYRVSVGFKSEDELGAVGLLYFLFTISTIYCVSQHESYIQSFYARKRDLLTEAGGITSDEIEDVIKTGREQARKSYSWDLYGLLFLLFGLFAFDFLPGRGVFQYCWQAASAIFLQSIILGLYLLVIRVSAEHSPWWRRTWVLQIVGAASIGGSAIIFLVAPYQALARTGGRG